MLQRFEVIYEHSCESWILYSPTIPNVGDYIDIDDGSNLVVKSRTFKFSRSTGSGCILTVEKLNEGIEIRT